MQNLLYIAIAPVITILIYLYIKDKYEKEPKRLALFCFICGALLSFPIAQSEKFLMQFAPGNNYVYYAFYVSFIVASFVEETYKYVILYLIIYKNRNFNEPFDGLLYAGFISLGFASIENILYVISPKMGGLETGILRGIFSVPAHTIFAMYMGYYIAIYKFFKYFDKSPKRLIFFSYFLPILIHGVYDVLLFSNMRNIQILFLIFYIYILTRSFYMIRKFVKISPFRMTSMKRKSDKIE